MKLASRSRHAAAGPAQSPKPKATPISFHCLRPPGHELRQYYSSGLPLHLPLLGDDEAQADAMTGGPSGTTVEALLSPSNRLVPSSARAHVTS